jgi:GMP synthase-like glutamine amidotransferase
MVRLFHGEMPAEETFKEIGWTPISITPHGQVDSLLGYLPENATVFQWHSNGFDLPVGAIRLVSFRPLQHAGLSTRQDHLRAAVSPRGGPPYDRTLARRAIQRSGSIRTR